MTFVCDNFVQSINFVWQLCFNSNPLLPKTNSVCIHDKKITVRVILFNPQFKYMNFIYQREIHIYIYIHLTLIPLALVASESIVNIDSEATRARGIIIVLIKSN